MVTIEELLNHPNISVKEQGEFKVLKYKNKVFYKALWDEATREARGLVLDKDNNIVNYPFTKIYNLGENGTVVDKELLVECPRKVNGFMGCASHYKGKSVFSTTGSTNSEFAKLAERVIRKQCSGIDDFLKTYAGTSFMFEICDPEDPHIVDEEQGAYLIGARDNSLGSPLLHETTLDFLASLAGFKRPVVVTCKLRELDMDVLHEGYMVRCFKTGETLCKIKSKHYLTKKFLMRSPKAYNWEDVEEEYFALVSTIREKFSEDAWSALSVAERKRFIECYI